jgi:capsular exopolysaccharide synthesis family protein
MMDSSLKSLDETEKFLKMPVLSSVPRVNGSQLSSNQLVMTSKRKLSGAESFRSLRTSLALLPKSSEHRLFLFTSAMPEEGKTFTSLNYAHSLAQQGLRVLLIDFDLRRPSVEQSLCASHGKLAGVTDFLNGQQAFSQVTHETGIPNFMFAPAGAPVSNPAELLAQESVDTLLAAALDNYDKVVIDSAPIFGVSDSLLLVGKVHVACLVVQVCKTPRRKVARAVQILRNASTPLAGIVLNRVPPNDRRNSDDPYYDYGYANEQSENIVPLARASS